MAGLRTALAASLALQLASAQPEPSVGPIEATCEFQATTQTVPGSGLESVSSLSPALSLSLCLSLSVCLSLSLFCRPAR